MDKRKFKCKNCVKTFFHRSSLSRHNLTHIKNNNENKFICIYCKKNFTQRENLKRHGRISCKKRKNISKLKVREDKQTKNKIINLKEIRKKEKLNIETSIKNLKKDEIINPCKEKCCLQKKINKEINRQMKITKSKQEKIKKNTIIQKKQKEISKNVNLSAKPITKKPQIPSKFPALASPSLHTKNICNQADHLYLQSQNQILILCDGLTYDLTSKIVKPPIENETLENKRLVKELSHYNNVKEVKNVINAKFKHLTNDLIFNTNFCSPIRCECFSKNVEQSGNCLFGCCNDCGYECFCDKGLVKKHSHINCQHRRIWHADHFDFVVGDVLHREVLGRCYSHGKVKISTFKPF